MSPTEVRGSTIDTVAAPPPTEDHEEAAHEEEHQHSAPTLNPDCTREVDVEVPAEEISRQFQKVVRRYRKLSRIPGFRAGKVPESLIRSRFADQIRRDVLEAVVPDSVRSAIAAKNLTPVSQPQASQLDLEDGKPLGFRVVFEVVPEFSVDGYQEIKVEKPSAALTDEEYDRELEGLRDSHAVMEPVTEDRPLADGDVASLTFAGKILGAIENGEFKPLPEPVAPQAETAVESPPASEDATAAAAEPAPEPTPEPISGKDVLFEVGGRNTLDSFNNALRGTKAGAHVSFETDYPADFGEPRLAGKRVAYEVTVDSIKKKILPALDDSFAREMGDFENFDAFSKHLRDIMEHSKQHRMEQETVGKLTDALVARFDFPVPESLIEDQLDQRLDRGLRILASQGMRPDQMRHLDFDRIRSDQRGVATAEVKGALLFQRIAETEKIEISEAELDKELEALARSRGETVEALRRRLTENDGLARIRERLRREKTEHLLYERLPA